MSIISAQRIKINDKKESISWASEEGGFGVLTITYQDNGRYHVDAEYIGFDTMMQIIAKAMEPAREFCANYERDNQDMAFEEEQLKTKNGKDEV